MKKISLKAFCNFLLNEAREDVELAFLLAEIEISFSFLINHKSSVKSNFLAFSVATRRNEKNPKHALLEFGSLIRNSNDGG